VYAYRCTFYKLQVTFSQLNFRFTKFYVHRFELFIALLFLTLLTLKVDTCDLEHEMNVSMLSLFVFCCLRHHLILMLHAPTLFVFCLLLGLRLIRNQLARLMKPHKRLSHYLLYVLLSSISHSVCFVNCPIKRIHYEPGPVIEGVY
jgi:hypothetical protein